MRLYTFGRTRKTDGHLIYYGYRRETAVVRSEIVGIAHRHCMGSVGLNFKCAKTIRFPYDLRTVLTENSQESQRKNSCDARMNCKHIRRSQSSPTMSKIVGKIADRKIVQRSGQM